MAHPSLFLLIVPLDFTANLDSALRQMENDMKSLKLETEQSRARIRDLELEVEKARIAAMKAQSDADGDRVKQAEAQRRIELLESEKSGR